MLVLHLEQNDAYYTTKGNYDDMRTETRNIRSSNDPMSIDFSWSQLTSQDIYKTSTVNNFFSSVFTKEDTTTVPNLQLRVYDTPITDIIVTEEQNKKKIMKLNPMKSPGPDGMYVRIIKKLIDDINTPLISSTYSLTETKEIPKQWKPG